MLGLIQYDKTIKLLLKKNILFILIFKFQTLNLINLNTLELWQKTNHLQKRKIRKSLQKP